jgi:hypothetical protein
VLLIKTSAFCWNNNCVIINMHGKTTIKTPIYHGTVSDPTKLGRLWTSCYNGPELRQQMETLQSLILRMKSEAVFYFYYSGYCGLFIG